MTTELLSAILDDGIRNINFFEGRLLTAKDLRDQQDANRQSHWQLGRAVGAGVVEGLEVELENAGQGNTVPVVKVKRGLAINARGQVLELAKEHVLVRLSRTVTQPETEDDIFYNCAKPPDTKKIPNGAGIYLLVLSPAAGYKDYAPMSGLDDKGKVGSCGRRYKVDGITFRLLGLDPPSLSDWSISESTRALLRDDLLSAGNPARVGETARLSKLRNIVAHLCFGTERLAAIPGDPFKQERGMPAFGTYGAIDELHKAEGGLTDCDVPLALLYWTLQGIAFLDLWPVRRRPVPPPASSSAWSSLLSGRRYAEAEASFFQFQSQVDLLTGGTLTQGVLASVEAPKYFGYLPAAGIIPVTVSSLRAYYLKKGGSVPIDLIGTDQGFDYRVFFGNMTVRDPVFMEGARVGHIYREACLYPPVSPDSKEMLWLYLVRQNVETIRTGRLRRPQAYLIFTNGHMPFHGEARYDLSRWDYSNYNS